MSLAYHQMLLRKQSAFATVAQHPANASIISMTTAAAAAALSDSRLNIEATHLMFYTSLIKM